MKKPLLFALLAAVGLQVAVLFGMLVRAEIPLWVGEEVRLKVVPIDPRSLFRGHYARLEYDITRLPQSAFGDGRTLQRSQRVYVSLKPGADGVHVIAGAGTERPDEGLFIRGRVDEIWPEILSDSGETSYRLRYGIEAYFAPKERTQALERGLQSGGVAVLKLAGSGRAALQDVIPGPEQSPQQ